MHGPPWKILRRVSKGDYVYAVVPDHPFATKDGYVLEHRVVMENKLGRLLKRREVVHHKNEHKKDNEDRNLRLMKWSKHSRHHALQRGTNKVKLRCPWCRTKFRRDRSQTFLGKKSGTYTCCSPSCRGKFSRMVQLNGLTRNVRKAIAKNVIKEYVKYTHP